MADLFVAAQHDADLWFEHGVRFEEGEQASEFLVIVSGTASVDRNGLHVADVGPGDFHGEISLLDAGRRAATVTATSPTYIMVATQREFIAMLETYPTIAREVLPTLAARARLFGGDAFVHPVLTSPSRIGASISLPERHGRGHNGHEQHRQPRFEIRFRRRRSSELSRSGGSSRP